MVVLLQPVGIVEQFFERSPQSWPMDLPLDGQGKILRCVAKRSRQPINSCKKSDLVNIQFDSQNIDLTWLRPGFSRKKPQIGRLESVNHTVNDKSVLWFAHRFNPSSTSSRVSLQDKIGLLRLKSPKTWTESPNLNWKVLKQLTFVQNLFSKSTQNIDPTGFCWIFGEIQKFQTESHCLRPTVKRWVRNGLVTKLYLVEIGRNAWKCSGAVYTFNLTSPSPTSNISAQCQFTSVFG